MLSCKLTVNGGWENWSSFGLCNATCGGGIQVRNRTCNDPPPSGGGLPCAGDSSEVQLCNQLACPGKSCFMCSNYVSNV